LKRLSTTTFDFHAQKPPAWRMALSRRDRLIVARHEVPGERCREPPWSRRDGRSHCQTQRHLSPKPSSCLRLQRAGAVTPGNPLALKTSKTKSRTTTKDDGRTSTKEALQENMRGRAKFNSTKYLNVIKSKWIFFLITKNPMSIGSNLDSFTWLGGIFRGFPFPVQHRRELIEQLFMPLRKAINSYPRLGVNRSALDSTMKDRPFSGAQRRSFDPVGDRAWVGEW
jgi:hypothetical protein